MSCFAVKAVLSRLLIATISQVTRHSPGLAAPAASLPLVPILGMMRLWRETGDAGRFASQAKATFRHVPPLLPLVLPLPWMIRQGAGFRPALVTGFPVMVSLSGLLVLVAPRFNLSL